AALQGFTQAQRCLCVSSEHARREVPHGMERAGILPGDCGEAAVAGRGVVLGRHRPLAILAGRRLSLRGTHAAGIDGCRTEAAKHRDERRPRHPHPLITPCGSGKRGTRNRAGQDPARPVEPQLRAARNAYLSGGEGEIRTHEPRKEPPVFKTGAINRSATSPHSIQWLVLILSGGGHRSGAPNGRGCWRRSQDCGCRGGAAAQATQRLHLPCWFTQTPASFKSPASSYTFTRRTGDTRSRVTARD